MQGQFCEKKEKKTKKDQTTTNHLSHIIKSLFQIFDKQGQGQKSFYSF